MNKKNRQYTEEFKREALNTRGTVNHATDIAESHHRAFIKYADQNAIETALSHAVEAQAYDLLSTILTDALIDLIAKGYIHQLVDWANYIPKNLITADLHLSVAYCWMLSFVTGNTDIRSYLEITDELILQGDYNERTLNWYRINRAILDARVEIEVGNFGILEDVGTVFDGINVIDYPLPFFIYKTMQAVKLYYHTELSQAIQIMESVHALEVIDGFEALAQLAVGDLGNFYFLQGEFDQAEKNYQHIIDFYDALNISDVPFAAIGWLGLSRLEIERYNLESASQHVTMALEIASKGRLTRPLLYCYRIESAIQLAEKNWDTAHTSLHRLAAITLSWQGTENMQADTVIGAEHARIWLHEGKTQEAINWARQSYPLSDSIYPFIEYRTRVLEVIAEIELLVGTFELGERIILALIDLCSSNQLHQYLSHYYVIYSTGLFHAGNIEKAHVYLSLGSALAKQQDSVWAFLARGDWIIGVIEFALHSAIETSFLEKVQLFSHSVHNHRHIKKQFNGREIEILTMLKAGLTDKQIAAHLTISINTVRYHTKRIYRKLRVNSRIKAVSIAEHLHLI